MGPQHRPGVWFRMARPMHRLSARTVEELVRAGKRAYHADGAGLYLLVSGPGTGSWVYRYRIDGKLRDMGLGGVLDFRLAEAREKAREARKARAEGADPLEVRRALRAAQASSRKWGEATADYIDDHRGEWGPKQAEAWEKTLAAYGPDPEMPVRRVDTEVVLACLRPIWPTKTETATRVRGRIERVWDAEKVRGTVTGENPARWRGHLEHLLAKPGKLAKVRHHPALPWKDMPAFMARLRKRDGEARRALEWTILTAARTGETLGMVKAEVVGKEWRIPADRMKAGEAHVVPLVPRALALLDGMPDPPFPMSENGMLALLQRTLGVPVTVHGFRSTFTDWARDNAIAPDHVVDAALAHKVSDEVKAAYGRSKLLELRRDLMAAWAAFLAPARAA